MSTAMPDKATTAESRHWSEWLLLLLLAAAAATCIYTVEIVFMRVPVESSMGIVQKIFYFHVPSAYAMYLGATLCFVGSVGYLAKGKLGWDALARAGADVAVVMGLMVMISGPLWAAKAWGRYWTWDPRLTTSMLSLLIYVAYAILRSQGSSGDAGRRFGAALGILGAANLPIIHYSVQKWGGQHPKVITKGGGGLQHPDMKMALGLGFLTFTLITIVFVWQRAKVYLAESRIDALEQEAVALGLAGE